MGETQPHLDLALLHHDGNAGAYAIHIDELWWQETGRDGAILGKVLARFATGKGLTGIISPDNAPYNEAMHTELDLDPQGDIPVVFHELNTEHVSPELLAETPFLTLVAKAVISRHSLLGQKVGIVQTPTGNLQGVDNKL